MRLLVTGFGPFGSIAQNPSQILAERSGFANAVLEVSYSAVADWLDRLDGGAFDALLMMGVNGGATHVRMETVGHNRTARIADVRGFVPGRRKIEAAGPWRRKATLWTPAMLRARFVRGRDDLAHSRNAGSYLCNFSLYSALGRFPHHRVGFLHVPPESALPIDRQLAILAELVDELSQP